MLDFYISSSCHRRQLCRRPLAGQRDGLAAAIRPDSYTVLTGRRILSVIG
jgi:hypothetical protein